MSKKTSPPAEHDSVSYPKHYTSSPATCSFCGKGIECIQVTRHMGYNLGNVVKYLWRTDLKNGIEDLKKALWYLSDEVAKRERQAKESKV